MPRLALEYEIFDLTRFLGSQYVNVFENMFSKILLGNNSFEMRKLLFSGKKDVAKPFYLKNNQ